MSESAATPTDKYVRIEQDMNRPRIDYAMTMMLKQVMFSAEDRQWWVLAVDHAGNVRAQEWVVFYEQTAREERWFTGEEAFGEAIRKRIEENW